MNPEEYSNLQGVEEHHWYYTGKRKIVRYWLNRIRPIGKNDLLMDCGAGAGAFASEMASYCNVIAMDDHMESLKILRLRLDREKVREGSCTSIPMDDHECDYVTALDVLEHIPDDRKAFVELVRILKPGGVLGITVPAMNCLWSDWDEVLHHQRRYDRKTLQLLLRHEEMEWFHIGYVNVATFPAVYAIRKMRILREWMGLAKGARMEDKLPPAWLNRFLKSLFVMLACQKWIPFPFGVGLLAVGRKRH